MFLFRFLSFLPLVILYSIIFISLITTLVKWEGKWGINRYKNSYPYRNINPLQYTNNRFWGSPPLSTRTKLDYRQQIMIVSLLLPLVRTLNPTQFYFVISMTVYLVHKLISMPTQSKKPYRQPSSTQHINSATHKWRQRRCLKEEHILRP